MKRTQVFLILFTLLSVARIFAQEDNNSSADKWMRIESAGKDFSVALPTNAIIDAEQHKYGQTLKAVAYQNGVEMELQIIKDKNVKDRPLGIYPIDSKKLTSFKLGEFSIIKIEPRSPLRNFSNMFRILKKDTLYMLNVSAKTGQEKEAARFLSSIMLDGKAFFVPKEKQDFPEEVVPVSALKTSPEVVEAFARKLHKNKINVTYEVSNVEKEEIEDGDFTRRAIILERSYPVIDRNLGIDGAFDVKLQVNFLANGQIGDIVVLSVVNKEIAELCVEAAQKTRFVPAQSGGKNVNSVRIVEYHIQLFNFPGRVVR